MIKSYYIYCTKILILVNIIAYILISSSYLYASTTHIYNSQLSTNSTNNIIAQVEIEGNRRIDTAAILDCIQTRKGSKLNPKILSEDIKSIYKLGYFDNVAVNVTNSPKGKIVTFIVHERPIIEKITIKGNKEISKDKIKDVITIKKFDVVNQATIKQNIDKIKNLYLNKGFINTNVTYKLTHISPERVDLTFLIHEGEEVHIKSIKFEGNHAFSDSDLLDLMETDVWHPWWWLTWRHIKEIFSGNNGILNQDTLNRDLGKILSFYHNHGYINAKVGTPDIKYKGKWIYITIPITEGYKYKIGSIHIKQKLFKSKTLLSIIQLKPGDIYSQKILQQDIMKLTDKFADKGYAYVQITPLIKKDKKHKLVDITFVVNKGPKVYFERIEITGNTITRDKVIRRELRVKELGPFSATGLRKSNILLNRLGYFKQVTITPKRGSAPNKMKLDVHVKEQPTGTFSIGAGYSSLDKFLFMAEIKKRNFLGKGETLSFQCNFSSKSRQYNFSFTEPYFRDTKLTVGIDAYNWMNEYYDYTKKDTGGALRFGYAFTDNFSASITFRINNTTLSNLPENPSIILLDSLSIRSTRSVTFGFNYDSRDSYYYPTRGWDNSLTLEYAGFGGDSAFVKTIGLISYFHPIWKELIGHIKFGIGYVTQASGGKLPIYEKFFLGGLDTVRGYRYGHISPVDPATGDRIGGERMAYMQNEAIFPLIKSMGLSGVVFYDLGNVWRQKQGYDFSRLKTSVGLGIRWISPIGPLRIEWGYKLNPKPGESRSHWEFRIGGIF